ncbi:auxin-responsive protein SAUR41-like [Phragmites australis]|uniref:auxin-responsive protein SAUR41-like n=1 Tax=Phragmites australis TaxID=29695 RepID=UPI002D77D356|nr:auxin-responsive protein SAUR41-like [Phragmites australis]
MGDDGAKVTAGIKQIVRLRELLHKWQIMALGAAKQQEQEEHGVPEAASAIPPFVLRRLQRTVTVDSDDENCNSPEPPPDVPRGYCPVYVGPEQRRFVIPTSYLGHPVFRLLLEKAEEEFGFRHEGALAIPCETETFKYILQCVERHDKSLAADTDADEGNPAMGLEQEPAMHHAS